VHIICITVRENRIIGCQIFSNLLLKSAFQRIFNVIQFFLVKIKWHIKWKYLIQKFHDICLSYYFNIIKYGHNFLNQCWRPSNHAIITSLVLIFGMKIYFSYKKRVKKYHLKLKILFFFFKQMRIPKCVPINLFLIWDFYRNLKNI
jgi:hypothetical protein